MSDAPPTPVSVREAYRLWAPTYGTENPTTALDETAVRELTPPLAGKTLLDAGCGTGCRLPDQRTPGPRSAVGIDLTPEMVRRAKERSPERRVAVGDVRALPLGGRVFDVVWCRLVIGYLAELDQAYAELARVTRRGGVVVLTDFHPAAARAGHVRSFRDAAGTLHLIEHHVHDPLEHERAARRAGLSLDARVDLPVGPAVREFYERASLLDRYAEQVGLPLVFAVRFRI